MNTTDTPSPLKDEQARTKTAPLSKKSDYRSTMDVRWCSGCGDFHVLNALTSAWAQLGIARDDIALISGIGCSSRLPYYCQTWGFHTIHGRAPSVAMGLKITRPELSVWVITGDGDGLSIGGNHLMHICRRNPNINVLLFNNEIYGLTKGQPSPTSARGLTTRTTPQGSIDPPANALALAIASGATFVARVVDTDLAMMRDVFQQAYHHPGLSFIEIYTNCVIFNDGAFSKVEKRTQRQDHSLILEPDKPLLFGHNRDKTLTFHIHEGFKPQPLSQVPEPLIHRPQLPQASYAYALSQLQLPAFPLPLGVLRQITQPCYETTVAALRTSPSPHAPSISSRQMLQNILNRAQFQQQTPPSSATTSPSPPSSSPSSH